MKLSLNHDLGPLKELAHARIDNAAEEARRPFITTIAGQEMIYLEKRREAEDFLGGASINQCPHLKGEADANSIPYMDQAVEYLTMAQIWSTVSGVIEAVRIHSKSLVTAATDPKQIDEVQPDFGSALRPLGISG